MASLEALQAKLEGKNALKFPRYQLYSVWGKEVNVALALSLSVCLLPCLSLFLLFFSQEQMNLTEL